MSQFVALNHTVHKEIRILTDRVEAMGANERMVPVVLSELIKLIVNYPVVWTKKADTGEFICVALLGFDEGENVFWDGSVWSSLYVPLNISRQPFYVGQSHDLNKVDSLEPIENITELSYEICIDQDSALISEQRGERLFDSSGADSHYLQSIKSSLAQLLDGERHTLALREYLLDLDLLVPLQLDITFADESVSQLKGIYSIDEDKLAQLSEVDVIALHKKGYLKAIHLMQASLSHLYGLIDKKINAVQLRKIKGAPPYF